MLEMRLATEADCWKVFQWRNRPEVYQHGNARPVTKNEHAAWFQEILGPKHVLWILEPDAGTVRLDFDKIFADEYSAWLSIYLLPEFQGKGDGPAIIHEACRRAFAEKPWLNNIWAAVHRDNEQSMKAFLKAGFDIEMDIQAVGLDGDLHSAMVKRRDAPLSW